MNLITRIFIWIGWCSLLLHATTTILSVDPTATTATARVQTDQIGNCTFRVSEGNALPGVAVNDVNTTLFPGSNSDARLGSEIIGHIHSFTAGTRPSLAISTLAADGNFYSRALAAATPHIMGATCGGDAEVTFLFTTLNPQSSSPGPEFTQPSNSSSTFGNEAWPTIFWNKEQTGSPHDGVGEDQKIIDPYTGLKLSHFQQTGIGGWTYSNFQIEFASAGAAQSAGTSTNWASPGNFIAGSGQTDCSGTCVSSQSPITIISPIPTYYATGSANYTYNATLSIDDAKFSITGCDDATLMANRVWQVAISLHPALNEVDSNWVSLPALDQCSPLTTTTHVSTSTGPSAAPEAFFGGWLTGVSNQIRSPDVLNTSGTATCTAGVCLQVTGAFFGINWKTGDVITIADSSPTCTSNVCTIASVQSAGQITLSQSLTITGAAWSFQGFAYLFRKATTTGAGHFTATSHTIYVGQQAGENSNGTFRHFSPVSTTTTYSRAGVNDGILRAGGCAYTVNFGGNIGLFFVIPATGEVRYLQSSLGGASIFSLQWDPVNACAFYSIDGSNNITNKKYNDLTFAETGYSSSKGEAADYCQADGGGCADHITTTPIISGTTLLSQISTAYPIYSGRAYSATYFPSWGIAGTIGDTMVLTSNITGGISDSFQIRCYFSISQAKVLSCIDTFSQSPLGWSVAHSSNAQGTNVTANAGRERVGINPLAIPPWVNNGTPAVTADIVCVVSRDPTCATPKTGICGSNSGSDAQGSCAGSYDTCPGTAYGDSGNNCVKLRIANQPALKNPAGVGSSYLTAFPWCSSMAGRTGVWSYVKPIQLGDGLRNEPAGVNQYDDIYLVVGITYLTGDLCDGPIELILWHSWDGWQNPVGTLPKTANGDPPTSGCITPSCVVAPGQPLYAGEAGHSSVWPSFLGTPCGQSPAITSPVCIDPSSIGLYHNDYSQTGSSDAGTLISTGVTNSYVRSGANPGIFAIGQPYQQFTLQNPTFNASTAQSGDFQSHLSLGVADLLATPFLSDGRPLAGQNAQQVFITVATPTLVGGFTKVYKSSGASWITASGSTYDPKRLPFYVKVGRYFLQDASNSGATFGDSNVNQFCVAWVAGRCVAGSSQGDLFINASFLNLASTSCGVNLDDGAVCAFTNATYGLNIIQQTVTPDYIGIRYRKVSELLGGLGHQDGFLNSNPTLAGDYALSNVQWVNGVSGINFLVSTPRFPDAASTDSAQYAGLLSMDVPAGVGTRARLKFGLLENEPAGSTSIHFYGTSRQEATYTCTVGSDPFAYASETMTCPTTPATITIPANPGHNIYAVLERLDNSNNVLATGPVQIFVVP